MKITFRSICTLFAAALIGTAGSASADADYPNKPIRMIIPHAPGGPTDVVARALAQALTNSLRQQVIVDSRPGGGTVIATTNLANSPKDGYTLMLVTPEFVTNPSLQSKLPYDTVKDFAPISLVATYPLVLVTRTDFPASTTKELIALAKSKPGQFNFGSGGNGSANQLAMEMFRTMAGLDMVHVPYKGNAPAVVDLLGGGLQMMFTGMPPVISHIKANKLKAIAVSGSKRSPTAPDIPTIAESGLPGYDVYAWYGVLAPAGTPKSIITKLNTEIVKAMQTPEVKQSLASLSAEATTNTPEEFGAMIKSEIARWEKVIKTVGLSAETPAAAPVSRQ